MPDSRPSHAAGGGERTGSRVVDLRAGVSAETLATREQYLSVGEQSGGGLIGDHPSGKAKGSADRVVQLGDCAIQAWLPTPRKSIAKTPSNQHLVLPPFDFML